MRIRLLLFALILTAAAQAQTKKQLTDSLEVVKEQIEFNPDSVDLRLKKASLNIQLGQYEYAKYEYDLVLRMAPTNLAALFYRAYVNMKMRRYTFARSDYNKLLTIVPGNYEARLGLAVLNQREGKYTEAIDIINRMTSDFPDSAAVYAARADIEKDKEMYELAELDYAAAMQRDPQNSDYILSRADVLIRMGRKREAQTHLDALVRIGIPRGSLKDYYKRCREKK